MRVDGMNDRPSAHLLVDGHVHFHPCFDPEGFLAAAVANFRGNSTGVGAGVSGCLLFTESAGAQFFRGLRDRPESIPGWTARPAAEEESLIVRDREGTELVLLAGRQIVTRERLEVLALATAVEIPDGGELGSTIAEVQAADGLPVVPWGFGKWSGTRGERVSRIVDSAAPGRVFLGDNGGRLALGGRPPLFGRAEARGLVVLPGSDPLPFPGESAKVGRYGFVLDCELDLDRPAASLRRTVRELKESPRTFGRLESLPRFVHRQVSMQLRRFRRS
jgi:hypothetical protein